MSQILNKRDASGTNCANNNANNKNAHSKADFSTFNNTNANPGVN